MNVGSAVKEIAALGALDRKVELPDGSVAIDGKVVYSPKRLAPVEVASLDAIVRVVKHHLDDGSPVIVCGAFDVQVFDLKRPARHLERRETYIWAAQGGKVPTSLEGAPEDLASEVLRLFAETPDRDRLASLLQNVRIEETQVKKTGIGFKVSSSMSVGGDGWGDFEKPYFRLVPQEAVWADLLNVSADPETEFGLDFLVQMNRIDPVSMSVVPTGVNEWKRSVAERASIYIREALDDESVAVVA